MNSKLLLVLLLYGVSFSTTVPSATLPPGVRGLATRAPQHVTIDGDLAEFKGAFCTPVEYFHADLTNRPAQFFYMWDDTAFYAALRTLDAKPANNAPDNQLWEGDAVEWYFDTREGEKFRSQQWGPGAVHCYWTGLTRTNIQSRFCLRPGYLDAIPKIGVEVGSRRTVDGLEVEFKLPWTNFPAFKPKEGSVIAVDAELCYSDGGPRVFRSFVYGSPLSVQQPANLAKVQLVDRFEPEFWAQCGAVLAPIRSDIPWLQKTLPQVTAYMALPPPETAAFEKVGFRLVNPNGRTIAEYPGQIEAFGGGGQFRRASAQWSADVAAPGAHFLLGIVYGAGGKELVRIGPRLVSVNMVPGY